MGRALTSTGQPRVSDSYLLRQDRNEYMHDNISLATALTRRDFLRQAAAGAMALGGAGLIAGCGGGGGSSSGGYLPDVTRFVPNYARLITLDHWPRLPVKVYFATDVVITPQGGIPTHVNDVIIAGFNQWSAATGGVISYGIVPTAAEANITVSTVVVPRPSGRTETGSTDVDTDGSTLTGATTKIFVWPDITNTELNLGQRTTAAHEFGHMLGIAGHSDDPNDLMYPSHGPVDDIPLSTRDVNTIKTLYYYLFP